MKTPRLIFLHLYIFLFLLIGNLSPVRAQDSNAMLGQAKQMYEEKKYRESLDLLDKIMGSSNGSAEVHHFRGKCYMDLSETDSAIQAYHTGLNLDKNYANSYYNLGLCYYDKNKYRDALQTFQTYTRLKPEDADGWMQQGVSYDYMNQIDSSRFFFDKSLQIDPMHWETYYYRARLNARLNNFRDAMADINKAIDLNKTTLQLYLLRGYLRDESKDYEGAVEDYSHALEIDREDTYALTARASAYMSLDQFDESIADAQVVLSKKNTDYKALHILAYGYYLKEDFVKSAEYAERGKALNPDESVFCTLAGLSYLYQKSYDRALQNFNMAIAKDPSSTENYRFKVDALLLKNTPSKKLKGDKRVLLEGIDAGSIERLDQLVADKQGAYCYEKLLEKFNNSYKTMALDEYFLLYYAQTALEGYTPYGANTDEIIQDMRDKLEQGDYLSCAREGTALLKQNPLILDAYFYTAIAYYHQEDYIHYEEYITKYRCFMKSILATGQGDSFESAYLVISPKDEYSLLYFLGYVAEEQSLIMGEGHTYDLLEAVNEDNEKRKFYFNIDKPFQSLGSMLQEDKAIKEKKKNIKKS